MQNCWPPFWKIHITPHVIRHTLLHPHVIRIRLLHLLEIWLVAFRIYEIWKINYISSKYMIIFYSQFIINLQYYYSCWHQFFIFINVYVFFLLVLTATIALSVVRSQFKEGMELDTSFYIAIAALLSSVVTLVFSIVAFKINKNLVGSQKE